MATMGACPGQHRAMVPDFLAYILGGAAEGAGTPAAFCRGALHVKKFMPKAYPPRTATTPQAHRRHSDRSHGAPCHDGGHTSFHRPLWVAPRPPSRLGPIQGPAMPDARPWTGGAAPPPGAVAAGALHQPIPHAAGPGVGGGGGQGFLSLGSLQQQEEAGGPTFLSPLRSEESLGVDLKAEDLRDFTLLDLSFALTPRGATDASGGGDAMLRHIPGGEGG